MTNINITHPQIFLLYARSAGLLVTLGTLVSLGLMQASAAGFSYWLAHWVTHQASGTVDHVQIVTHVAHSNSSSLYNSVANMVQRYWYTKQSCQKASSC